MSSLKNTRIHVVDDDSSTLLAVKFLLEDFVCQEENFNQEKIMNQLLSENSKKSMESF